MIEIDGSWGEGGGQILRSALALSLLTGTAFRIRRIRANRKKPGLRPQHLTALTAAQQIGNAEVQGGQLGACEIAFIPGSTRSGRYAFDVGTAGSCALVLQTILPALLTADGASELHLAGGTHNPLAPPFEFLDKTFLPLLGRMGASVKATLDQPGFYPAGGGKIRVSIQPAKKLNPLHLSERTEIKACRAKALVAKLPRHIADRELKVIQEKLGWPAENLHVVEVENSLGPGNVLLAEIESPQLTEVFAGFGERGVSAERVASKVVATIKVYLAAGAPVGPYLADQLLIPLALAGEGNFHTLSPTPHTLTNILVIEKFLNVEIILEELESSVWNIRLHHRA